MIDNLEIFGLVASGLHLGGLASAVHAILHARSPQGTVAWALSLVLLPYVTLPLYWVFGHSRFDGYITARRAWRKEIEPVASGLREHESEFRAEIDDERGAFRVVELLASTPFTRGNAVRLLVDGEASFRAIFAAIDAAREYVLVQSYIVRDDQLGRELKSRLVERARAGVRVCFLYDEIGSYALPRAYLDDLEAAGVSTSSFQPMRAHTGRFQVNFRNHRKIIVVDGRRAFMGGLNVGDEYLGRDPAFGRWRDTHIELDGPAVQCVQLCFAEDWYWGTHELPELEWHPKASERDDQKVLVLPTSPADTFESCGLFFSHAIQAATRRVWIASPYFVPDSTVVSALVIAGLRGADVRILLPSKPDHLLVYLASFTYLSECERAGVKFYRYEAGFLHQKVMLIDDTVAAVGTANLDNRSFKLNFEITAIVYDRGFASEVERMLVTDFQHSQHMGAQDYEGRSFAFRLAARVARLFAPML